MKSSILSTANIGWDSSLLSLSQTKKPSAFLEKFHESGFTKISDLLWLLPLRIDVTPTLLPFRSAELNKYFRGSGKVIHVEVKPAFGRRGKGNILLYNGFAVVKDDLSAESISLRWFNLYPNQKKQIENLQTLQFIGLVQEFKAQKQIINPQILGDEIISPYMIEYPTVQKISGTQIKKIIELIPGTLWSNIPSTLPELDYDKKISLADAFKTIHGKIDSKVFSNDIKEKAENRLIYEEFLTDQLKIQTRRKFIKRKDAPVVSLGASSLEKILQALPFSLTLDQKKVFEEIIVDFNSGHPMMRMIQGDVGCGKTIVAYLASRIMVENQLQVALMCPTETLAKQHYETFKQLVPNLEIQILLGSTKSKERKILLQELKQGVIKILIGTHSLFQENVEFFKLGFAIIDEQHKFGVEQRLKLVSKGDGVHCLIMTATPIPRTLSLAQYGDLDISSIKTLPNGRKGIKTRITERQNFDKYIDFVRSRLLMREQAYFVFPAIDESETIDIQNVKESLSKYQALFRGYRVEMLHGQMKPDEKEKIVKEFREQKIHILLSTSVIEVGINIPNATVMSIYNPERFGLSSLHQLRGRVGRGDKPGFCFLVLDKEISQEAFQRLEVIEKNLDGFVIAEEDLKFRGEGDLFGVDQSGSVSQKKLANYLVHSAILEEVVSDLNRLKVISPHLIDPILEKLAKNQKILDTI